jgi:hypothetical protein
MKSQRRERHRLHMHVLENVEPPTFVQRMCERHLHKRYERQPQQSERWQGTLYHPSRPGQRPKTSAGKRDWSLRTE